MPGLQTALTTYANNTSVGDENAGAAYGQDLQGIVAGCVLRAQETIILLNQVVAKIANSADPLSVAATNCISNFLN